MRDNFEETELKVIGLDDSEEVFYSYENKIVKLTINNWALQIIEVIFKTVILFIDWRCRKDISNLYINNSGSSMFKKTLTQLEEIPDFQNENPKFKLYQFVNKFEEPCFEIGSVGFDFFFFNNETEYMKNKPFKSNKIL